MSFTRERDGFTVSDDPARLDAGAIHAYLTRSYWAAGVPRATVERSIQGSLCFGLYTDGEHVAGWEQVGFARAPFPERFMVIDRPTLYQS
jgi:hypothetical protein